jgi:hypothetical protein
LCIKVSAATAHFQGVPSSNHTSLLKTGSRKCKESHSIDKMPSKKKGGKPSGGDEGDQNTRIAIVKSEKCKPKKCKQECKKSCPVVRLGKLCIEVGPKSKLAFISEPLCIGKFTIVRHPQFYASPFISLHLSSFQVVVFV